MNKIVPPINSGDRGDEVVNLQDALLLLVKADVVPTTNVVEKKGLMNGLRTDRQERIYGERTKAVIARAQRAFALDPHGNVDDRTAKMLNQEVARLGPGVDPVVEPPVPPLVDPPQPPAGKHVATGRVVFARGEAAANLPLKLYHRGFGAELRELASKNSDADGAFSLEYDAPATPVNIEVVAEGAGVERTSLSSVVPSARPVEDFPRLVAPDALRPAAAEYQRLKEALRTQRLDLDNAADIVKLAGAKEDDNSRDLSLLANSTGWDARLLALLCLACELQAKTKVTVAGADKVMSIQALYGLARTGMPTSAALLALSVKVAVQESLERADLDRITDLGAEAIATELKLFEEFSKSALRNQKALGGLNSTGELLSKAGLDNAQLAIVQDALFEHAGDSDKFWQTLGDRMPDKVEGLRAQGRLAYLTSNNLQLVERVAPVAARRTGMVEAGYHTAEKWEAELRALSANDDARLKELIPPAFLDEKDLAGSVKSYAANMAKDVQASYRTQVMAKKIADGEGLLVSGHDRAMASKFLMHADGLAFEVGRTQVDAFVKENKQALLNAGLGEAEVKAGAAAAKAVQRVYQMTPDDEAMKVMVELGFRSAAQVVAMKYEDFLYHYGRHFKDEMTVQIIYRKCEQISATTLNVFTGRKMLESAPAVSGVSGDADHRNSEIANLNQQLTDHLGDRPNMEELFGSIDYCECEHCRSVLSPAAYFVDLLQFLNIRDTPPSNLWSNALARWKTEHKNIDYPFKNAADLAAWQAAHPGGDPATRKRNPFEVLKERRPDLEHLPLTCENTNTVIPYIDLVNEILEYHVANGALDAGAVHDTGPATTAELLAEPQNVIKEAYGTLNGERKAMKLPFDLWTATMRAFSDHFEQPFWSVLDTLRSDDTDASRRAVFMEQLGLSPAEQAILFSTDPFARWHELFGYDNEAAAISALTSAKTLARRLGVTYKELYAMLRGRWINPGLDAMVLLTKIGIDPTDVFQYERYQAELATPDLSAADRTEHQDFIAGFDARKAALVTEWQPRINDIAARIDTRMASQSLKDLVVLADPNTGCDFSLTKLRTADGRVPAASDAWRILFLKLNFLVRLRLKTGWTLDELDQALVTFTPTSVPPTTGAAFGNAMRTAVLLLAHGRWLADRLNLGRNGRIKLLTLWSPIPTAGGDPLYARLFLTRGILKSDPVFDHPLGEYLSDPAVLLKDHVMAVQSATGLAQDEIDMILRANGSNDPAQARLTIPVLSMLYRHAVLAKGIRMKVADLLALKRITGIDPFKPLSNAVVNDLANDALLHGTVRFMETAELIKASGVPIAKLDDLFTSAGDRTAEEDRIRSSARIIRDGLQRIEMDNGAPVPGEVTEDTLRARLNSVLSLAALEEMMAILNSTRLFEHVLNDVAENDSFDPVKYGVQGIQVRYERGARRQWIAHQGVLTREKRLAIIAGIKAPEAAYKNGLKALEDKCTALLKQFLEEQLDGQLLPDDLIATEQEPLPKKRATICRKLLPTIRTTSVRDLVMSTINGSIGLEEPMDALFLDDARTLSAPGAADKPIWNALVHEGLQRASMEWRTTPDASGDPAMEKDTAEVTSAIAGLPVGIQSVVMRGYLEVPATGNYDLHIFCANAGCGLLLTLDTFIDPVISITTDAANKDVNAVVSLDAGRLYKYELKATTTSGGTVHMEVASDDLEQGPLSRLGLLSNRTFETVRTILVRAAKAAEIVNEFGLAPREVLQLLSPASAFPGLDLNHLPVLPTAMLQADVAASFNSWVRIARYAALKRELDPDGDALIDLLQLAARQHPVGADRGSAVVADTKEYCDRMALLTSRTASQVVEALTALGLVFDATDVPGGFVVSCPSLMRETGLERLWKVLQLTARWGVSAASLKAWTATTDAALTNDRRALLARDMRDCVKARYAEDDWLRVAPSIFDGLRQQQRDALVSYLCQKLGKDGVDDLFEHFLIDPGMEPVCRTSRLRQAIATVQLFIQRCLLNLEPDVPPSIIDAEQWAWMKRYRIWEAGRKIFLFPENLLLPEFMDVKSHLYTAFEALLNQGEVNKEMVEDAFFAYLSGLEPLARMEPVALHLQEDEQDPGSNTLHLLARLPNTQQHFYRFYQDGIWSPWEEASDEITGDHIVLVHWHDRINVFWLNFMVQGDEDEALKKPIAASQGPHQVTRKVQVQLNWCERVNGEWTTRTAARMDTDEDTSAGRSSITLSVTGRFDANAYCAHAVKGFEEGFETYVDIRITPAGTIPATFRVWGKNSPPEVVTTATGSDGQDLPVAWPFSGTERANTQVDKDQLQLNTKKRLKDKEEVAKLTNVVIRNEGPLGRNEGRPFSVVGLRSKLRDYDTEHTGLVSPFFYRDADHVFYVEPTLTEKKFREYDGYGMPPVIREKPPRGKLPELRPYHPRPKWDPVFDPRARNVEDVLTDWATKPGTLVHYGDRLLGAGGGLAQLETVLAANGGIVTAVKPDRAVINTGNAVTTEVSPADLHIVGAAGMRGEREITMGNNLRGIADLNMGRIGIR